MKLDHCVSQAPAFSEEDFLRAENDFLRDELELREQEHTLEIYETILDCIQKEGSVSKSLEVMFGENVSSMPNFEAEMKAQYEAALEGIVHAISELAEKGRNAMMDRGFSEAKKKLKELSSKKSDEISFPISIPFHILDIGLFEDICRDWASFVNTRDNKEDVIRDLKQVEESFTVFNDKMNGDYKVSNASGLKDEIDDLETAIYTYEKYLNTEVYQTSIIKAKRLFGENSPELNRYLRMGNLLHRAVGYRILKAVNALYKAVNK